MEKIYDVAIVGSGLGGLLCGLILGKEGMSVCIVEKNKQAGGLLRSFTKDGCIFDTGVHYVGSLGEAQVLNRFFKYFGIIDKLKLKELDRDSYDIINFKNKEYKFASGYDEFIETLAQEFPKERKNLVVFSEKIKAVCDSLDLYNLREVSNNSLEIEYLAQNAWDYIKSTFKNDTLCHVLAGSNPLFAGISYKTPLLIYSLILNSNINSSWRFVDGSSQIADALIEKISDNGGKIIIGKQASKFVKNNGKINSIELIDGERIHAKTFISSLHPLNTIGMLDEDSFPKPYRKRIQSLENTISMFSLYITLKDDCFPYMNQNYYYYKTDNVWIADNYSPRTFPEFYLLITPATSKSDKFADSMIVMTYMKYEETEKWNNSVVEDRGDEYLEFKREKSEKLIDLVEKKFPNIRNYIKNYVSSTPLTIRDYIGSPNGAVYGILKDSHNPIKSFISPKTKIPNLLLTGQNVNFHGVIGVTMGSVLTSSQLVGLNYLIRKIKSA